MHREQNHCFPLNFFILLVKTASIFSVDKSISRTKCHSTGSQQCAGEPGREEIIFQATPRVATLWIAAQMITTTWYPTIHRSCFITCCVGRLTFLPQNKHVKKFVIFLFHKFCEVIDCVRVIMYSIVGLLVKNKVYFLYH